MEALRRVGLPGRSHNPSSGALLSRSRRIWGDPGPLKCRRDSGQAPNRAKCWWQNYVEAIYRIGRAEDEGDEVLFTTALSERGEILSAENMRREMVLKLNMMEANYSPMQYEKKSKRGRG